MLLIFTLYGSTSSSLNTKQLIRTPNYKIFQHFKIITQFDACADFLLPLTLIVLPLGTLSESLNRTVTRHDMQSALTFCAVLSAGVLTATKGFFGVRSAMPWPVAIYKTEMQAK